MVYHCRSFKSVQATFACCKKKVRARMHGTSSEAEGMRNEAPKRVRGVWGVSMHFPRGEVWGEVLSPPKPIFDDFHLKYCNFMGHFFGRFRAWFTVR